MDRLQHEDTDKNNKTENTPIVCTHDEGEIRIQLEGSHTTSTTTESIASADKKNVKFEDEEKEREHIEFMKAEQQILRDENISVVDLCADSLEADCSQYQANKQLEQLSSDSPFQTDFEIVKEVISQQFLEEKKVEITSKFHSNSTVTASCDFKNVACQTYLSDLISLKELNLLDISSLTSRSEQPSSLNNYAPAENACASDYGLQEEVIKGPLTEPIIQQPLTPPVDIQTLQRTPSFHVITIEPDSTPYLTESRRPPLCQRIWDVFCHFCAAILLCLQVNRDCIFCLGFFAAFVVSASFLTAFFYHTLVESPALWDSTEN